MRLLITGGCGCIVYKLIEEFRSRAIVGYTMHNQVCPIVGATGFSLDVCDRNRTREIIREFSPDAIIHTAGATDVDFCERKPDVGWRINTKRTGNIIEGAEEIGSTVIFYSTPFVFDGTKRSYAPHDVPNPLNVYGETKFAAEQMVLDSTAPGLILRTDQPFGWSKNWQRDTMIEWVLNQLRRNEPFPVFQDWRNCPTYIDDLVEMNLSLIMNEHRGIYHCVGSEYVSRYQWAMLIADIFGMNKQLIIKGHSEKANFPAVRPNVYLQNTKMHADTGIETHSLIESTRKLHEVVNESD